MNCAILIIGALLWEDGFRDSWRQDRLQLHNGQAVSAPIRYGRRSRTRANTFTIVLDPTTPVGQAFLVPCVRRVETVADLTDEAEALWRAERNDASGSGISSNWGCVGALFRTGMDDGSVAQGWSRYFRTGSTPVAPVDEDGTLGIRWPTRTTDGAPVAADVILATATQAEPDQPTPTQIADAWMEQGSGEERYFFRNVQNGILTTEDEAIAQRLITCAPTWIDNEEYASAMEKLSTKPGHRSPNSPGEGGTHDG